MAKYSGKRRFGVLVLAVAAAGALATGISAAKPKPLRGTISADGSSTVGPWTTAAAEAFQRKNRGVRITVGISGTGGGFERFCRGETDLSNASRPIRNSEHLRCLDAGIRWLALHVANDGITVVVNRDNTWADCLTTAELKKIWDSGSKVNNWSEVRAGFPNVPLKLFGPGTDSGTFEFFTEAINGRARRSRSDYSASEDDNILVQGVSGERGGLGYFGLSYYEENRNRLRAVRVDNGRGCIAPSTPTVQAGTYKPLARPLFIYAKRTSFRRPEVAAFLGYALNNQASIASRADFVPLTKRQATKARASFQRALRQVFG
jgi:phosphate transport system substrate-binding protein